MGLKQKKKKEGKFGEIPLDQNTAFSIILHSHLISLNCAILQLSREQKFRLFLSCFQSPGGDKVCFPPHNNVLILSVKGNQYQKKRVDCLKNVRIQGEWNSRIGPLQRTAQDEAGTPGYSSRKEGNRNQGKSNFQHPHRVDLALGKGILHSSVSVNRHC